MTNKTNESRRRFLKLSMAGAIAGVISKPAWPSDLVPLTEDDPMAKALAYHADASTVDPARHRAFKPGDSCSNCLYFKSGKEQGIGTCGLFPGKLVSADGWCKTWVKG